MSTEIVNVIDLINRDTLLYGSLTLFFALFITDFKVSNC